MQAAVLFIKPQPTPEVARDCGVMMNRIALHNPTGPECETVTGIARLLHLIALESLDAVQKLPLYCPAVWFSPLRPASRVRVCVVCVLASHLQP